MAWKISIGEQIDTLENDSIRIKTALLGAELISLQINHPIHGWTGLLVNDDDTNPQHDYWKKHAPFLFPIVGGIQNHRSVTTDGKVIELPNHGFARISTFERVDYGSDFDSAWVEYLLVYKTDDKLVYPWDCSLSIRYTLTDCKLDIAVTILNDSSDTMWFQFGWHPGFKVPVHGNASNRSTVEIAIPEGEHVQMEVDNNCLLTGETRSFVNTGKLSLTDTELEETFILDLEEFDSRWVSLYDPEAGIKTTVQFDDYPHLGLWSVSGAPYICIEPWQGCDDSVEQTPFDKKFGIDSILPNHADSRTISTVIEY